MELDKDEAKFLGLVKEKIELNKGEAKVSGLIEVEHAARQR